MGSKRILVIGGGAAGFFAAINTARLLPTAQVTVLEKNH
ncbi:MAG: NAD(P)/FAD-dependent oxidoreductase [Chitinophagales bacterium]|nr:NAD(P)/FAD-dependent oxidoreductase [Chitinophagales bacterium]